MKWCLGLCATAFLAGLIAVPCRAGEVGDYLTKDGKLKEAVTIKTGGIEFLAPPGEVWIIEPSGAWSRKLTESKGQLSAKQLAALAQHLATQDFNSLPKMQGYESKGPDGADRAYQYVVIGFGKKQAAFHTKNGGITGRLPPETGRSESRGVVTVHRVGTGLGRHAANIRTPGKAREISGGDKQREVVGLPKQNGTSMASRKMLYA